MFTAGPQSNQNLKANNQNEMWITSKHGHTVGVRNMSFGIISHSKLFICFVLTEHGGLGGEH